MYAWFYMKLLGKLDTSEGRFNQNDVQLQNHDAQ